MKAVINYILITYVDPSDLYTVKYGSGIIFLDEEGPVEVSDLIKLSRDQNLHLLVPHLAKLSDKSISPGEDISHPTGVHLQYMTTTISLQKVIEDDSSE